MQNIYTLGQTGSYGDQARKTILPHSTPIFVPSNEGIVESVVRENGIGIVPVSNPYGGSVNPSWDALERHRKEVIIAGSHEHQLDHALFQRCEHVGSEIRRIFSHQQAYDQSKPFLDRHYPGHRFVPSNSTIDAPGMILCSTDAAIASARGVRNNPELAQKFQIVQKYTGAEGNATKFVVIATRKSAEEVMNLGPSELDILRITLEDKPFQLALKLLAIGGLGANIHEWGKAKANPGISSLYTALLITSSLPREITPAGFETMGIEPIPKKEELC